MEIMVLKILILYDKQGYGHQERARILKEILSAEFDGEVVVLAGSELLGSDSVDCIIALWNILLKWNMCRTVDLVVNFLVRLIPLPIIEVMNIGRFMDKLDALRPDVIVCTADGFNKSLGQYAARTGTHFYAVLTEISVFLDVVSRNATHFVYFSETADALRSFDVTKAYFAHDIDKGDGVWRKLSYILHYWLDYWPIRLGNRLYHDLRTSCLPQNDVSCIVIGPLVDKRHFQGKHRSELVRQLGLPPTPVTLLIASGSIGGRYVKRIVDLISRHFGHGTSIIVLCGHDLRMIEYLQVRARDLKTACLTAVGFVENVDEYMAVSDCVIARPSAGILVEALVNRTPLITFGRATTNDIGSVQLIEKYSMGEICDSEANLVTALKLSLIHI